MEQCGSLIAGLSPAYFALVMSSGILSIACHLLDFQFLAVLLCWLMAIPCCFIYVALAAWFLMFVGLLRFLTVLSAKSH